MNNNFVNIIGDLDLKRDSETLSSSFHDASFQEVKRLFALTIETCRKRQSRIHNIHFSNERLLPVLGMTIQATA